MLLQSVGSLSFSALTLLVGRQSIRTVKHWFVGGNDLTGALHVLLLQLSPLTTSVMETFWYWLTQIHLENGR